MIDKYLTSTLSEQLSQQPEPGILKAIIKSGVEGKHAIALWKLPNQEKKHLIVHVSPEQPKVKADLEELPPGFLVTPFINPENKNSSFIKADLYFKIGAKSTDQVGIPSISNDLTDHFYGLLEKNLSNKMVAQTPYFTAFNDTIEATGKEKFIDNVKEAIGLIRENKLQKVVPSKVKIVPVDDALDIVDTFQKLCAAYPNAFVSLVTVPGEGTWLGASPETLISIDQYNMFRTVALAGTQKLGNYPSAGAAAWTQKEIEEQALVSRYIINCFKKIRLREYDEKGPKTVIAGNLMHLKTEYRVDINAVNFPQLGTVMLNLLHPTSAVCGMPKAPALQFIADHEKFERSFYSGFLGPVNINNESHLFVNLRCMQLLENKAILYAGAGITEDSDPEKEWQETEMKCQTLLDVIRISQQVKD